MPDIRKLRDLITKPQAGFWGDERRTSTRSRAVRVVRSGDAAGHRLLDVRYLPVRWFSDCELEKARCEPGDVVLVGSGEVGDAAVVSITPSPEPIAVSNFVRLLRTRPGVDQAWFGHLMRWPTIKAAAVRVSGGTTLQNLSATFFDIPIHVPTLVDQQRIAEILDTLDDSIDATGQLLAKQQSLLISVVEDQVRRCLDGGSQVKELGEVVNVIDCKHYTPEYSDEGTPVVRPRNVKAWALDMSDVARVTPTDYDVLTEPHRPAEGDIIMSRNASFGAAAYVDTQEPFAIGQDVVVLSPRTNDMRFVTACLVSSHVQSQIQRLSAGSTFGRINLADIRRLSMPVPTGAEQARIADAVWQQRYEIKHEIHSLRKLGCLRAGLADDLLTGRVRTVAA